MHDKTRQFPVCLFHFPAGLVVLVNLRAEFFNASILFWHTTDIRLYQYGISPVQAAFQIGNASVMLCNQKPGRAEACGFSTVSTFNTTEQQQAQCWIRRLHVSGGRHFFGHCCYLLVAGLLIY